MDNLVTTHTSYSNGEVNKRKLLVLNNISYNDDFANKFLEKINQLEENQKNNLGKLIMNAIEIKNLTVAYGENIAMKSNAPTVGRFLQLMRASTVSFCRRFGQQSLTRRFMLGLSRNWL